MENIFDRIIVCDVETSGTDLKTHGLLSIGAVRLTNPKETFYTELNLLPEEGFAPEALAITGFSIGTIYNNPDKENAKSGVKEFYKWAETFRSSTDLLIFAGHNPQFDASFLRKRIPSWPFQYRLIDLHSVAFGRFHESLCMPQICDKCDVSREPEVHNALTGAEVETQCFRKLFGFTDVTLPTFPKCEFSKY